MNCAANNPDVQGKVRDLYDLGDRLLLVASDRISAFDYILEDEIPDKGRILTQLSLFWFELLGDIAPHHLISCDIKDLPDQFRDQSDYLKGRFMLVKKANMFPVECIVRGYLTGSGLKEYKACQSVCGIPLPQGLVNSSKLDMPLFTPSTKAAIGDHDENISFDQCIDLIGKDHARIIKEKSLAVYAKARDYAQSKGIIIADTKFEFGLIDGNIILADEVLTPDSSRFWSLDTYEIGKEQESFDKQFVRNWLSANWDMNGRPPRLPKDIIEKTREKYIQVYEKISGRTFLF